MSNRLSLLLAGALCAFAAPAFSAPFLVKVSGKGVDAAGCGTAAAPCRTLQFAHDQVAAGGYIVTVDPADYGPLLVAKSVNVANESAGVALARATTTSSAGVGSIGGLDDTLRLRGLTIEGNGPATWGLVFRGKHLELTDCVVRKSANGGVFINMIGNPSAAMVDTTLTDNLGPGLWGSLSAGYPKGLRLINNSGGGVHVSPISPGWGPVVIEDSLAANDPGKSNAGVGGFSAGVVPLYIRNTTVRGFPVGVKTMPGVIGLARSTLTGNAVAAQGPGVFSAGDNVVRGNADDALGALSPEALR